MSACKINIGHNRDHIGKQPHTPQFVTDVLEAEAEVWPVWLATSRHFDPETTEHCSEGTTVVGITAADEQTLSNYIEEVCGHLEQECVSVLWGSFNEGRNPRKFEGQFIGPCAVDTPDGPLTGWQVNGGPEVLSWDPQYFLDLDGKPLTEGR